MTWESNSLSGESSGLIVMFGHRASAVPAMILLGALLVALTATVAALVDHRRLYLRTAVVGALIALGGVGWYGIQITGERVRAIGIDSAGNLIEPEAASRLGIGWYLSAAALLTVAVLAIGLSRRARSIS